MGRATLGRIINVIGEPIDEKGDLSKEQEILRTYYSVVLSTCTHTRRFCDRYFLVL